MTSDGVDNRARLREEKLMLILAPLSVRHVGMSGVAESGGKIETSKNALLVAQSAIEFDSDDHRYSSRTVVTLLELGVRWFDRTDDLTAVSGTRLQIDPLKQERLHHGCHPNPRFHAQSTGRLDATC